VSRTHIITNNLIRQTLTGKKNFLKTSPFDGNKVSLNENKLRDKAHHLNVFPRIQITKTFEIEYLMFLDIQSRLEHVRDRNNLTNKTIMEMQMEAINFFGSPQTKSFSGTLGQNKIRGTVYINEQTNTLAFVNKHNRECRTLIIMSEE